MKYHIGSIILCVLLTIGCGSSSNTSSSQPKSQTSNSTTDTNVVTSVSAMEPGDIYYIDFSNGIADVNFSGSSPGSSYFLIVQSTIQSSSPVTITSSDISANLSSSFDTILREKESELSESEETPSYSNQSLSKSMSKAVGDSAVFKVLSSITSVSSYKTVNATQKCVKDNIIVYVDNNVSSENLADADIETLCNQFESSAASEIEILGEPSDVNGDGHVVTLISTAVNELGASGGGIITGYFYASDLYDSTASNPTSNEMEIIYILAPDPEGEYGTAISKEFAMSNLMTAVVPHELQHAISYYQHVFVNGGASEDSWLNEALSHFVEDLVGFGQENPSRVEVYLGSPESTPLAPSGSPDLGERGGEYLFLRYLYEQSANPNAFLAGLENTVNTGIENIETAFAGGDANFDEWNEFMRRWAIAVILTNTGITGTGQYQFDDRAWNSGTSHWHGVCLICDTEDGRGTVLSGPSAPEIDSSIMSLSLSGTSTAFFTILDAPATLSLSGNTISGLQGVLIRTE